MDPDAEVPNPDNCAHALQRKEDCGMDSPTTYFHWGFILISLPNLAVIAGMIVLFAVALVAPFPHGEEGKDGHN
jgi:hypothetical protein